MQIQSMKDEREDLVQKAINLTQSIKTLKAELSQRENIADQLKREIKDLKQTINLLNNGKDYSMYADYENEGGANRFSDNRKQSLKDKMKRAGA